MDFNKALYHLKGGARVARAGWNGRDMYLYLVPSTRFKTNRPPLSDILGEGIDVTYSAHIDMYTAQGTFVPWVASHSDLLADDWYVLGLPH